MTIDGTPTLLGIPFDGQSSYLRGAGDAPAKIREALGRAWLEESLSRYERGTFLIQHCQNILNTAEKQIELIGRNQNGEIKTAPLPEEPDE